MIEIGDTVHTKSGKLYTVRSFFHVIRENEDHAHLVPVKPHPSRHSTHARIESLTLVRTRELTLAFHHATLSDLAGFDPAARARERELAGHWLSRAEHRNDDSRAALCLGSDRIIELEEKCAS